MSCCKDPKYVSGSCKSIGRAGPLLSSLNRQLIALGFYKYNDGRDPKTKVEMHIFYHKTGTARVMVKIRKENLKITVYPDPNSILAGNDPDYKHLSRQVMANWSSLNNGKKEA